MSDDEYAMTSFKRRKVTDSKESESEDDLDVLQPSSTKKKLTRKMIEADDLDVLDENEGIDDKDSSERSVVSDGESLTGMEEDEHVPVTSYRDYKGAQDIDYENGVDDFIDDDEGMQYVTENVSEDRKKYYDLALEYFGEGIRYFINAVGSAEEVEEEKMQPETDLHAPVEIPLRTQEMDQAKEVEEKIWKEENLMTDRDLEIASKDIPERMQLMGDMRILDDYQDRLDCCNWIYEELQKHPTTEFQTTDVTLVKEQISLVLKYYAEDHLEPHYVMKYLSREVSLLSDEVIWGVCELYHEYLDLLDQCKSVRTQLNQIRDYLATQELTDGMESLRRLLSSMVAELATPNKQRMMLIQNYGRLLFSLLHMNEDEKLTQRRGNRSEMQLRRLWSPGLLDLCTRFSVELDRVETNLLSHAQSSVPQDPGMTPDDLVEDQLHRTPDLQSQKSATTLLNEASQLYGLLLSFDPSVIRQARDILYNTAVVNSKPTIRGVHEIDGSHPLYGYHRLRGKPLDDMIEQDFLCLEEGMQDGLFTYSIDVTKGTQELQRMLEELLTNSTSEYYVLQQQSVRACVSSLVRSTVEYLKTRMRQQAYEDVARRCGDALVKLIEYRGYRNKHNKLASVLSLSFSSELNQSSVAVVLNENGVVADSLILGRGGRIAKLEEQSYLDNIQHLYERNAVDVVILNAGLQSQTLQIQRNIEEMVQRVAEEKHWERPEVLIVDDSVAQLRLARDENVHYEQSLKKFKHAIYMARYVQNPLREVCALDNNPGNPEESDLFQLPLHPYQSSVPAIYLRRVFTRELCMEVVNAGVCLQDAMAYQDAYAELQFIPGLGFRKVRSMIDKLVTEGKSLRNRDDMKKVLGLGDVVFQNCNGFIRPGFAVRRMTNIEELRADSPYHVLDMFRWPTHLYRPAIDICKFLTREVGVFSGQEAVAEVVLHYPNYEKDDDGEPELIIEEEEQELEVMIPDFHTLPLRLLSNELRGDGFDQRNQIRSVSGEDLFYLVADETKETFHVGIEVVARVVRIIDGLRILVRLDNNLQGSISAQEFSDNPRDIEIASNLIDVGSSITCRVLRIDVTNFRVELSSRPSVVNNRLTSNVVLDKYFVREPEDWENDIVEEMQTQLVVEQRARQLAKRSIFNTHYMCVNQQGAIEELKDKPVGSCLFRPSPEGLDQIILTYKMLPDLYASYDVIEKQKDPQDRSKLGAILVLCEQQYTELDEIVDRFVGELTALIHDISIFPKYRDETDKTVDAEVEAAGKANPTHLPYLISLSRAHPGLLRVTYYRRGSTLHEYAELRPMGIVYDKRLFGHVESFLNHFKSNLKQIVQRRMNERESVQAAMLRHPVQSPAGQPPAQPFVPEYVQYPMYPPQPYGMPRGPQPPYRPPPHY